MENSFKNRIAVLWIIMAVSMSVHSILSFLEPGIINQVISEEIYQGMDPTSMLFMMSIFWLVPLWMAFFSVTFKTSINRWLNLIVGAVFTILNVWHLTEPCCAMNHQKLIVILTVLATALIVWYAWNMSKEKE